ncbi:RelA/SpoT domain-containing protein [Streptomyces sp. NBC_01750]|uniref:RelA/SpoT domain-containing protein n=1 Tax=Streptomyces sp. NBC_01750 TaxID=2975928 RepID=UPI002DD9B98E|nr:RelA/SpoT domain-containing protein [Streptomyces sp. NBC_01750]WSD30571.1 RelA/SpoT domain-containing protein [Streptomyces sp. NBC_01750]
MNAVNEAFHRYRVERPRIEKAAQLTAAHLWRRAARARIMCEVSHRAKEVGSFVTKAHHKRYTDPWAQITDKAGVRIVVQHRGLLDPALGLVKECLTLVGKPEDNRDAPGDEDRLQYPRLHVQVQAYGDQTGDDGYPYECEIQIRTEATDLWARMSHKLMYKTGATAVPPDVRRSLYRLIALVELYDLEVERGVDALAQHPDFTHSNRLLAEAEHIYRTFTDHHHRRDLSEDVVDVLLRTIDGEPNYGDRLAQFAEQRREDLERAYEDYGPTSDHFLRHGRYVLASQPESLIIFERLSTVKMLLRGIWEDHLPETMLKDMAEIWGVHL